MNSSGIWVRETMVTKCDYLACLYFQVYFHCGIMLMWMNNTTCLDSGSEYYCLPFTYHYQLFVAVDYKQYHK